MTKEEYRRAAEDLIYLCACMASGETPDQDRVGKMNLSDLTRVSELHMLKSCAGAALEKAGIKQEAFAEAKNKAIRKAVLFDTERRAVLEALENEGIRHMPLKGCVLKDFYPGIGMREMADNDILCDPERSRDVQRIMERLGFQTVSYVQDDWSHNCYQKPPVCNFEMHRALFAPSHDARLFRYYQTIWEKMIRDEACRFRYHLSPEDFYIYMIAHEYKHYSGIGTGLRSLLDTYIYVTENHLDFGYVRGETEKLGIRLFEENNRMLAFRLFRNEPLGEAEQEMLEHILFAGVYGNIPGYILREIRERGRRGYVLSRMALPLKEMCSLYPILNRAPLLYPLCCGHRLIHALIFKRERVMLELKSVLKRKE